MNLLGLDSKPCCRCEAAGTEVFEEVGSHIDTRKDAKHAIDHHKVAASLHGPLEMFPFPELHQVAQVLPL